ncbi:MAG: hypothetical protein ACTHML_15680 [Ginsengibacter sp.]
MSERKQLWANKQTAPANTKKEIMSGCDIAGKKLIHLKLFFSF